MIKGIGKKLLISMFVFFASLVGISAKEFTLDELANSVKETQPNATYIYVIGEYVFTSQHVLTTQDIMVAARSIKIENETEKVLNGSINDEMTISYFEGVFDDEWNLTGLDFVKNIVGTTPQKDKYEIKYIDYEKAVEIMDTDSLVEEAYNTIKNQASNKFNVELDQSDVNITIKDLEMTSLEALSGTGVATAAANFLNEEGIKSVTLTLGENSVTISTTEAADQEEVEKFFKALGTKSSDLVGKTIKATINLEDSYKTDDNNAFNINFYADVDTDSLVETAYNTIKKQAATNKFEISLNGSVAGVLLKDLEMTSLEALSGTGVATAAANFLNEDGIKSVTLTLGENSVTISTTEAADQEEVEKFFKALGTKSSDLVGKTIKATINLEEGFNKVGNNEFTIQFTSKIDTTNYVKKAYETIKNQAPASKFIISMKKTEVEILLKDLEMTSLEALMGTGVATAATNFLNEAGVKSVTLALGENSVTVSTTEEAAQEEVEKFFKALGTKSSDLVGETIKATINFEEGYVVTGDTEFSIYITEETRIDIDDLAQSAYNKIDSDNDFFSSSFSKNIVNVELKNLELTTTGAIFNTGLGVAALDFLNVEGIKSVTLVNGTNSLEVDKNNLKKDEFDIFFKKLGTNTGDLVDKSIVVKINFKDGYKTGNSNEFIINFLAKKYTVEFKKDGNLIDTKKVTTGNKVSAIENPTKTGYTFVKWVLNGSEFDFNTEITKDIVLEAEFNINKYAVTFASNNNDFGKPNTESLSVDYNTAIVVEGNKIIIGENIIEAIPTTNNSQYTYTFVEWVNAVDKVTGNVTITANFEQKINKYTVTYKNESDEIIGKQEVEYGTKVSDLTVPSIDDKIFDSFVGVSETNVITDDINIIVKYNTKVVVRNSINNSIDNAQNLIDDSLLEVSELQTLDGHNNETVELKFKQDIGLSNIENFLPSVISVMEEIKNNEAYESVILSYNGSTLNISTLVYEDLEFSDFIPPTTSGMDVKLLLTMAGLGHITPTGTTKSASLVAKFISKVSGLEGNSGMDILQVTVDGLAEGTKTTPIDVKITLKDGYKDENGNSEIHYDMIFTDSVQ